MRMGPTNTFIDELGLDKGRTWQKLNFTEDNAES